ncbi:MAG: Hsp20/alpha crystallin family protein [Candidatus Bathyarchaeia archaeon]
MASFFDFDEIEDFDIFDREFLKRIQRQLNEIEKAVKSGKIKGEWDVKRVDEPGVKGYVIQGRFWSDQPLGPFDPFEPLEPWRRRPMPKRPFRVPKGAFEEIREPLTDVFEEDKTVKIYVELPGEEKDDIQLNVTKGKVEVKTKRFYKMIDLPTLNIDIENVSSKYKNGVLEVTIPKKEKSPEEEKRKIKIE